MEEKNIPEQDALPISPDETVPVTKPEASEVPVIEALTFTSEESVPEQPDEVSQTADAAELPPVDGAPADSVPEEAPAAPSEAGEVEKQAEAPAAGVPTDANTPEAPIESASAVDLSILDDPELEEVLFAEEPETPSPDREFQEKSSQEFEEMMDAPAPEQRSPVSERPPRKGRPKRKKGEGLLGIPNMLVTVVWLALILAIGVTAGRMLWVCAADVLAFGREDKPVTITVYESDTIDEITDKLYKGGLIRYPKLFKLYASFAVDEGEIHPGIWDLNTRYDYHALVKMMSPSSTRSVVKLTIPEGYTCRQIFQLMEENKVCTFVDIGSYAASGELKDYWFLEGVSRGDFYSLEGYLFPDTYEFYKNDSPRNILEKMLDNFNARFTQEMREQLPVLNDHISDMMRKDGRSEEYIATHQLSMNDLVIVASMIEKETSGNKESPTIASVIYNRLFNWGDTPAYLNIDASIVYAWDGKTDLTAEDLKIDSPYNTYYHTGLTPTPISNPGVASLQAALNPASTNYYYYVLDPMAGSHIFSTTLEEHEANRAALAQANADG